MRIEKIEVGDIVTLNSFSGEIRRVVIEDLGDRVVICRIGEKGEGGSVAFPKSDIVQIERDGR